MDIFGVIEIPQGSIVKYEHDKTHGALLAERILNQPVPYNYGYIPDTLADDGDPLDVFVLGDVPLYPLSRVKLYVVGVLKCVDNGSQDDKIIARMDVPPASWHTNIGVDEIRRYLQTYKSGFVVEGYESADEALNVIERCQNGYLHAQIDY